MKIKFEWCTAKDEQFALAREVRNLVFVQEQGFGLIGEFDEMDECSQHLLLYSQEKVIGTARIFFEEAGVLHVGRVALLSAFRGQGFGLLMMEEIHEKARILQAKLLRLNAQEDKSSFYIRAGYTCVGDVFLEEGCPHVAMQRSVNL